MKPTDKQAADAVKAAVRELPPGCDVLLIVAAPEPQGEMTHRVEGYSNTTPAHAVQLYKHAAPLFARDGNARMIARPELDS